MPITGEELIAKIEKYTDKTDNLISSTVDIMKKQEEIQKADQLEKQETAYTKKKDPLDRLLTTNDLLSRLLKKQDKSKKDGGFLSELLDFFKSPLGLVTILGGALLGALLNDKFRDFLLNHLVTPLGKFFNPKSILNGLKDLVRPSDLANKQELETQGALGRSNVRIKEKGIMTPEKADKLTQALEEYQILEDELRLDDSRINKVENKQLGEEFRKRLGGNKGTTLEQRQKILKEMIVERIKVEKDLINETWGKEQGIVKPENLVPPDITDEKSIKEMIKKNEGFNQKAYKDQQGYSVGYGHFMNESDETKLPYKEVTKEVADKLFEEDFKTTKENSILFPGYDKLSESGKAVLIDMTYNMGANWWLGKAGKGKWTELINSANTGNIEGIITSIRDSNYARQVGERAEKNIQLLSENAPQETKAQLVQNNQANSPVVAKNAITETPETKIEYGSLDYLIRGIKEALGIIVAKQKPPNMTVSVDSRG